MAAADLTAARLRELLFYSPETGHFTRLVHRGGEPAGSLAGNICPINGYVRIGIDGRPYKAHRLAWLYQTGQWPASPIDHVNGIRSDNRWINLRVATVQQNNQNAHQPRIDSRSGRRGVSWFASRGVWRATISVDGKQKHLGYFSCPEAASVAYETAKRDAHPFAHGGGVNAS